MTALGLVELDLLATHAGVTPPFPLNARSFGRISGERELLLAVAVQTLRMRGLASPDGPTGMAAELVTALREHRGTVDLTLTDPETSVVALIYRDRALVCHQTSDELHLRRIADTAVAAELMTYVPEHPAAKCFPFTVDLANPGEDLPEVTGKGQLGATRNGARAGAELSWVDGPLGRLKVDVSDGTLSVNPLRQAALRLAVEELTTIARSR
ncbi:hypothetical protein Lesp02_39960 [Lentzea sp. NBRC 105346]|uniref:ESX secretion-associated protein EspG n=1 Tax=Lentzea sp. NBRC 105346 TaxID=3032205 RepID=UPI0024A41312|nr:ESX secretion-associated protein EspG [Lentzea sp. NBRC 105346]GLZ31808.1 hypothetical protein Lesp02_39960 [Lentzea sp. NBRC 105346]